jgi:uncharacterized protein (TIGR02001 family)
MVREAGTLQLSVLTAALIGGLALPAQAQDANQVELSATATFTTDYVFRGISQTTNNAAVQASLDASYGIFYIGMWGSNVDFAVPGQDIEIDYYAGIAPTWQGISFDIAALYYTYPGTCQGACGFGESDYFELKTGASYTFFEALTLGVTNYWSPDFAFESGTGDAIEGTIEYAFTNKLFNFFSPSVSALIGYQQVDDYGDYTYWNAGLTLGFMENWSADVRYWDTNADDATCINYSGFTNTCESRVVGTLSASF